ncbi:hypothetical protein SUGI_0247000 [Cryptomeria japonica]|nr:hypothetical protein SUGI_0247000 [Cryptomeria japonica]
MATASLLQFSQVLRPCRQHRDSTWFEGRKFLHNCRRYEHRMCMLSHGLSASTLRQHALSLKSSHKVNMPLCAVPNVHNVVTCQSGQPYQAVLLSIKTFSVVLSRAHNALQQSPLILRCAPAVGLIVFAAWGLGPFLQLIRHVVFHRSSRSWKKSSTYYFMTSYLRPILLWTGVILLCRAFDPVEALSETSEAIKRPLVDIVRSLSTVLAFVCCISSLIHQVYKFVMERQNHQDTSNLGFEFIRNALITAVCVVGVALFFENVGFPIQKWIFAGGFGTVLLTLAGREILTNYMSSIMIHATRPFVVNDWIQTKIDGYEVSGIVEHVGWWSPTIVRGEDREAVHIPNHKFTMTVVRNISQKPQWRIKTHFAISHLDVSKIKKILADMRKVLAKNPRVEQQRLHRRVFLAEVNPENQALMIMVSCFVNTRHMEEYLCVKEAILLELLRVIRHHNARLATPIRTLYKTYSDSVIENIPFEETISGRGGVSSNRHFLLIESSILNAEEKERRHSFQSNQELNTVQINGVASEVKGTESGIISSNDNINSDSSDAKNIHIRKESDPAAVDSQSKNIKPSLDAVETLPPKLHLEGFATMEQNSNDKALHGATLENPVDVPEVHVEAGIAKSDKVGSSNERASTKSVDSYQNVSKGGNNGTKSSTEVNSSAEEGKKVKSDSRSRLNGTKSSTEVHSSVAEKKKVKSDSTSKLNGTKSSAEVRSSVAEVNRVKSASISSLENELHSDKSKQEGQGFSPPSLEKKQSSNAISISSLPLEENKLLGVALNGPKKSLPIEGDATFQAEPKKLAACRNSNGNSGLKDKGESQLPPSGVMQSDQRDNQLNN